MPPRGLGRGRLGSMPLGGAEYYLDTQINNPSSDVFRRLQFKRRDPSTGRYEANWQDATEFVKRWGTIDTAVDDVRLNKFTHSGVNVTCRNDTGRFNDETNSSSLWFGWMTRYRSLMRIQAGYKTAGGELPSDATQGIFILTDEIEQDAVSNEVTLRGSSLQSVFDEVRARELPGIGATFTASELVTRIRDHTDGAGLSIFQEFISSGAWTIQTTTNYYVFNTDTLENMTTWGLMEKLAEAEGNVLLINRTGGIEFRNRDPRQSSSQFSFFGQGFPRQNIIKLKNENEAVNKLFTFFRLKYLDADTSTSYVTAGTTTAVSASNISWRYGQRVYEADNTFPLNTTTAQTIVNDLFTDFSGVKKEMDIDAKFHPTLEVLDRVDVSYRSYDVAFNSLWDVMVWDTDTWSREGNNFDYDGKAYKILGKRINLDNFVMGTKLREI